MSRQVPFFRLLIPFVCGIVTALAVGFQLNQLQSIVSVSVLFVLLLTSFAIRLVWAYRWVFGVVAYLYLFAAGFMLTQLTHSSSSIDHGSEYSAVVRVIDAPEVRLSSTRILVKLTMMLNNNEWQSVDEKSLLYFSAVDTIASKLQYGDILVLNSAFTAPPDARNPYQFDYAKYLSKKGVFRVSFVPAESWIRIGEKPHWLNSTTNKLRSGLLTLYRRVGIDGENLAVLSALTMGYKSLLDHETRRVFSASGAMHILAVSGLHVGILFTTLSGFLFFFNRIRKGKFFKAALLVGFLWFFAIFTGLSPSVMRAALMFSLVIVGTSFSHQTSIYNTLSASAFVILAANPMLITEVGFQLSYLAVLSIVFFYPHIYGILYIKNRWADKVWVLISVSLAAQIGTFVLGLYYFSQFPNYFLLTNLYAIPLAFVILYLSIGLLVLSPIPVAAGALGWLLNLTLTALNNLIKFTEGLPYSTSSGIFISDSQAITLIIAVLMVALFLEYRKSIYINVVLCCLIVFFAERGYHYSKKKAQTEVVIFADRQKSLIGFRNGTNLLLCAVDTTTGLTSNSFSFTLDGYLNRLGVGGSQQVIPLGALGLGDSDFRGVITRYRNELGSWLYFRDKLILIPEFIDNVNMQVPHRLDIDLLLITRNAAPNFPTLLNMVNPKLVVVDETVPPWQISSISDHAISKGVRMHSIAQSGALVLSL